MGGIGTVRRRGKTGNYFIDFGRRCTPRRIYSVRGIPFGESRPFAEGALAAIEKEASEGKRNLGDVVAEFAPDAGEARIEILMQQWLDLFDRKVRAGDRQPRTLESYERWQRTYFQWWAGKTIWEISEGTVEQWSLDLAPGLSNKTRRNVMAGFHAFCAWVGRNRKMFEIPAFDWPETEEHIPTTLTAEQQLLVLEAIPDAKRGLYLALATTGIRPSEARVVRVKAWTGETLRIVEGAKERRLGGVIRGPKKQRAKREMPVFPMLQRWLEAHVPETRRRWERDGWLFQNPDAYNTSGQWSDTAMRRTWMNACKEVGIECGLYEGTKHSLGTLLKDAGVDDRVIAAIFGHADVRSVEVYARIRNQAVRRALERLHLPNTTE